MSVTALALRLLAAQTQPLARGAELICAPGERVVALGPLRERGLRLCAPVHDGLQLSLDQLALSAQVPHLRLGRPQVYAPSAQRLARKRPSGLPAAGAPGARAARRPRPGA